MSSLGAHTTTAGHHSWQHAALSQLSRFQSRAKIAKAIDSFRSPRKVVLSVVALVLALVWLGQAVLGILFRSAADPEKLAIWIPFSLLLYTVFHFVKTSCKSPLEPFEWTPAETQILKSSPISRRQLIAYRLRGYLTSVVAKAACFTLVMIPDLQNLFAGFVGMVIGLSVIDLARIYLEVAMYGMKKHERIAFRTIVLTTAIGFLSFAFMKTVAGPQFETNVNSPAAFGFVQSFYATMMELTQNPVGKAIVAPFASIGNIVLSQSIDLAFVLRLLCATTAIAAAVYGLFGLDRFVIKRAEERELENLNTLCNKAAENNSTNAMRRRRHRTVPLRVKGAGSIAWYQALGAVHYRSTLAISLLVPTLLCCIPMLAKNHSPMVVLMNVVGGIIFYSFLLLPPALMLDFRRDVRRLAVWKAMPISPLAVTIGQLAIPVLLTSLFQLVVLALTAIFSSASWSTVAFTWPLLLPMNVFIFGLENIIFMVHPVRRNQEGIQVFLRTILTFTAKGLFFAVGLAITLSWAFASMKLGHMFNNPEIAGKALFAIGTWLFISGLAATSVVILAKLFDRLDPSEDLPAAS